MIRLPNSIKILALPLLLNSMFGCWNQSPSDKQIGGSIITTNHSPARVYLFTEGNLNPIDSAITDKNFRFEVPNGPTYVIWISQDTLYGNWTTVEPTSAATQLELKLQPIKWVTWNQAPNGEWQGYAGRFSTTDNGLRLPILPGSGTQLWKSGQQILNINWTNPSDSILLNWNQTTWKSLPETIQSSNSQELIDPRDQQAYPTVQIGTQIWMAKNLNFGLQIVPDSSAILSTQQKFCVGNQKSHCDANGALYQWHQAMNLSADCATQSCASQVKSPHQGICPDGWHLPSDSDWQVLYEALGSSLSFSQRIRDAQTGWQSWDTLALNPIGFKAWPSGLRYHKGDFKYFGGQQDLAALYWTTSEMPNDPRNAPVFSITNRANNLSFAELYKKLDAVAVRCLKNEK